jgi:hypothetical protein
VPLIRAVHRPRVTAARVLLVNMVFLLRLPRFVSFGLRQSRPKSRLSRNNLACTGPADT